jgi:UDP-N-acetyl-L-fucosamine synthase
MLKKLKLMILLGTRPEIIKLSQIIKQAPNFFDLTLVHTGQNYDYELNQVFFDDLDLPKPDFFLEVAGGDLGETIGNIISKSYKIMTSVMPDALLILGDTNSALASVSAKRLKIPVFHLEAGNRSFDENLPEEINRRMVDHISDVNLCYTQHALRNLNNEGLPLEFTFIVGSTMAEVLSQIDQNPRVSGILDKLNLKKDGYILFSAHREENIDKISHLEKIKMILDQLVAQYKVKVVFGMHPRTRKAFTANKIVLNSNVIVSEAFGLIDFLELQKNAYCVVSDSGTVSEEADYYMFPAVSLRTSTERPEGIEAGTFVIGNLTSESVIQSIELSRALRSNSSSYSKIPTYQFQDTSLRVLNIIQSYIPIVNKKIWMKQ